MDLADSLSFEDEKWLQTLMTSMRGLQNEGELCDAKIVDGENTTSWAHACVLASSSPVFAATFNSSNKKPKGTVHLDVDTNTVKHVLEFIYTGKMKIPDYSCLTQVLSIASELEIQPLVDWCVSLGVGSEGDLSSRAVFQTNQTDRIFQKSLNEIVDASDVKIEMGEDEDSNNLFSEANDDTESTSVPSDSESETVSEEKVVVKEEVTNPDSRMTLRRKQTKKKPVVEKRIGARVKKRQSFSCSVCKKTFRYATHLRAHKKKHVDPYAYYCEVCNQEFATMAIFKVHQARHAERLYTCEQCGTGFKWPGSLQKHWKSHPDFKPYPCKMCPERFRTGKDLKAHKDEVHHRKYKCQLCDKQLTTTGKLTEHMLRHLNAREYICCVCAARFNTKSQLTQHESMHQGHKRFQCDLCPKTCGSQRHLMEHKLSHSSEKAYECQYCGKRQKYLSGLRAHEKVHVAGKTMTCETCGKKFATSSQLKQHMNIHTGDKPYKCSLCGQCFTCASAKKRHEFAHTGLKPFPCSVCGKMFADKRDVRAHEKIHASEKPERCQQCGKCFHTSGGLKAHKRTHQDADRRMYPCTVCHKQFMRSHNRNLHEVKVHGLPAKKRYQVPVINAAGAPQPQGQQHLLPPPPSLIVPQEPHHDHNIMLSDSLIVLDQQTGSYATGIEQYV